MSFSTSIHSLSFWQRVHSRIVADLTLGRRRLTDLLLPLKATPDVVDLARSKLAQQRKALFSEYTALEQLILVDMVLTLELGRRRAATELPRLDSRIAANQQLIDLYQSTVGDLPNREVFERDLSLAAERLNELRAAGNGESIQHERQALRSLTRDLLVVGQEDVSTQLHWIRLLQAETDTLCSDREQLLSTTMVYLQLTSAEMANVFSRYGVLITEEPDTPAAPAPTESSPAATEAA